MSDEHAPDWVPYATRPVRPSFWETIGATLRASWRHRGVCVLLVLPYAMLSSIPAQMFRTFGSGRSGLPSETGWNLEELFVLGALFIAISGTLLLAGLLLYPVTVGATAMVGTAAVFGEAVEIAPILRTLGERAMRTVGAFLLGALIVAIAPVGAVLLSIVAVVVVQEAAAVVVSVTLVAAAVVVAIVIAVRLWLAIPVAVVEGTSPTDALRRSWDLSRGSSWRLIGVLVVLSLLTALVGSPLTTLAGLWEGLGGFAVGAALTTLAGVLSGVVLGVGTGVLYAGQVIVHSDEGDVEQT